MKDGTGKEIRVGDSVEYCYGDSYRITGSTRWIHRSYRTTIIGFTAKRVKIENEIGDPINVKAKYLTKTEKSNEGTKNAC